VPVEKWKSRFIKEIITVARPQGLWITCAKTSRLWKIQTKEYLFHNFHRLNFPQPVEKWKTMFKYCA
jgi:hypothetical protein